MADPITRTVGLDEIRQCTFCQGSLYPVYYELEVKQLMIDTASGRQMASLAMSMGPELADAMGPGVKVHQTGHWRALICSGCIVKGHALAIMSSGSEVDNE